MIIREREIEVPLQNIGSGQRPRKEFRMNARVAEIMQANDIEVRFDEDNNLFALKVGEYRTLIQEDGEFSKEFKVFTDKKDKNLRHIKAGKEHVFDIRITQFHESKDQDMKVVSGKVGDFSVKLIYHRMKSGSLQYRIFVAFKDGGKLRRIRLRNEFTEANQSSLEAMKAYTEKLIAEKDTKTLAEVKAQ
jgi:hypothetical protein